jgi:hypothetical protein
MPWITTGGGAVSPLTTKGDLYGFDTADDRVPVGTDGDVLTADSGAGLGVSWQAPGSGTVTFSDHTATWTAVTSNPAIGDGAITGRYMRVGDWVEGQIRIVMGSTTTYGSGTYRLTVPLSAASSWDGRITGVFTVLDSSASFAPRVGTTKFVTGTDTIEGMVDAAFWNQGGPITLANGDVAYLSFGYETDA